MLAFYSKCSLEMLATILGFITAQTVSKQAVAKRVSASCVEFVRRALYAVICSEKRKKFLLE